MAKSKCNPRNLTVHQLVEKARYSGWKQSDYDFGLLFREVPFYTRATYYTWVKTNGDVTKEYINKENLKMIGENSRVWTSMI
jgi:hypothetical protein